MSELRHLANTQSPLFNTLQSFSSNEAFEYEIAKSYPNVVKTRIELNMDSNASLGGQVVMALPKYGLLYKAIVKTRLKVGKDTADIGTDTTAVAYTSPRGLGAHIIQRASWMVHNKTIEQQTPQSCEAYLYSLSANEQESLKDIMVFEEQEWGTTASDNPAVATNVTEATTATAASTLYPQATATETNQIDVYTPLFFSFSHNSKQAVDLTFLQSTNLVLQYASLADIRNKRINADNAGDNIQVIAAKSKVILYFYQFPNDTMKEIERTLFDATTPLTVLGKSFFAETDKVTSAEDTPVDGQIKEVTIDLNCKNCVYQTAISVRAENALTASVAGHFICGQYLPIEEIELYIGGRSIWKVSGIELNAIDNSWGSGKNPYVSRAQAQTDTTFASEKIYLLNHGILPASHSQNTGVLSLKNCSSPQITVRFREPNALSKQQYRVFVGHFHYNLITQSGLDGAVQVGISL